MPWTPSCSVLSWWWLMNININQYERSLQFYEKLLLCEITHYFIPSKWALLVGSAGFQWFQFYIIWLTVDWQRANTFEMALSIINTFLQDNPLCHKLLPTSVLNVRLWQMRAIQIQQGSLTHLLSFPLIEWKHLLQISSTNWLLIWKLCNFLSQRYMQLDIPPVNHQVLYFPLSRLISFSYF